MSGHNAVLGVCVCVTLVFTILALRKYTDLTSHKIANFVTLVTWFLSASVVLILPFDVSATTYWNCLRGWYCNGTASAERPGCLPDAPLFNSSVPSLCDANNATCHCLPPASLNTLDALKGYWQFGYWTCQFLTWLVLPILQSYSIAGDFTVWQRLKSALKSNAYSYLSLGLLSLVLLIYLTVKSGMSISGLRQLVVVASNTWGLVLIILMLGYGIVDVPRSLWYRYDTKRYLKSMQFKVGAAHQSLSEKRDELKDIYDKIVESIATNSDESLSHALTVVAAKCPFDAAEQAAALSASTTSESSSTTRTPSQVTLRSLSALHSRLIATQQAVKRQEHLYEEAIIKAIAIGDVLDQADSTTKIFTSSTQQEGHTSSQKGRLRQLLGNTTAGKLEWYWKVKLRPKLFFALAIVSTTMSVIVAWSEATFFHNNPTLSLFALMVNAARHGSGYSRLEFVTFATLLYLSVCTYRVVIRLKIFNYELVPQQKTDAASLTFSSTILSRLVFPLCINFLTMSHYDSTVSQDPTLTQPTMFTVVMGHFQVFDFVNDFNAYYPITIIAVSAFALFRLGGRILACLGFPNLMSDSDTTEDFITEGKTLIRRAKRSLRAGNSVFESVATSMPKRGNLVLAGESPRSTRSKVTAAAAVSALSAQTAAPSSPARGSRGENSRSSGGSWFRSLMGRSSVGSRDDEEQLLESVESDHSRIDARPPARIFDDL
eukprot:m.75846 g.75846  ORF g.75846 m.75846 type:complete len:716 (+) comp12462_c0_seq2:3712-5859(+)